MRYESELNRRPATPHLHLTDCHSEVPGRGPTAHGNLRNLLRRGFGQKSMPGTGRPAIFSIGGLRRAETSSPRLRGKNIREGEKSLALGRSPFIAPPPPPISAQKA